jgi:hypothetical protein
MKRFFRFILLIILIFLGVGTLLDYGSQAIVRQEDLRRPRIYAYRNWQSVGVRANTGDRIEIQAQGRWLYTPGEYHGPEGHARYPAPSFYPLPGVAGGALIGRIGEEGQPFFVGKSMTWFAERDGLLYLRIDDDILGDNEGWVAVGVTVTPQKIEP